MSLAETVAANISRIRTMRDGGSSWDEIAATLGDEVGDTISAGSLKAAFSRAAKAAPTPAQIEKVVEVEEAQAEPENGDDEPDDMIGEDEEEEEIIPPPPPAVDRPKRTIDPDLPDHLLRVAGPRLNLPGWEDFLMGPAVGLLADRYGWFQPGNLRYYPSDPDPQRHGQPWLVARITAEEFFRRMTETVDVTTFRPDPASAVIERRVLSRFQVDRRRLFSAVAMTFGPTDRGRRVDWLMSSEGYFSSVEVIDRHYDYDIPAIGEIWRASRGVENEWKQQRAAA